MTITNDKVVSIEYTLKGSEGEIIDTSEGAGPLEYIHGRGYLIPGLEKELSGKSKGDEFKVEIAPAEAYGEYNENLLISVDKKHFPTDVEIEVGMQFEADGAQLVTVVEVSDTTVKIDANHPLAGKTLFFDVKVADVRDATTEELSQGLSQGCGCGGDCNCGGDCGSGECGGGCGCN